MRRPEIELLLRCARTRIDPECAGQIKALAGAHLDWTDLIQWAFQHGVLPLLARNLHSTCPGVVPPEILGRLQGDFATNAARNLFLISELLNILGLFTARDVPAITLKGPVLAHSVYGSASLRQSGDLDILVHRKDLLKARDLLIHEAPAPRYSIKGGGWPDPRALERGYHTELLRDDGRLVVELHWELMVPRFCIHLDPEPFWGRLEPVLVAGKTVTRFGSEDLLLYLCAHATKHHWERLSLICDVAELIRHAPGLDWGVLLRRAHLSGTARILFVGLLLANRLLDAPLPEAVLRRLRRDAVAGSLAREVHDRFDQDNPVPPGWDEARERFFLEVRERLSDRIRACVRHGRIPTTVDRAVLPPPAQAAIVLLDKLKPNRADHDLIRLPSSLGFLYYFLRPVRLIAKFARQRGWPAACSDKAS
jgi:hypothetical protein